MRTLFFEDIVVITGREPSAIYRYLADITVTCLVLKENKPYFIVFFGNSAYQREFIRQFERLYYALHPDKSEKLFPAEEVYKQIEEYRASPEGQAQEGRDLLGFELDPWYAQDRDFPNGLLVTVQLSLDNYMFLQGVSSQEDIELVTQIISH